ncbi:MAG: DUF5668 domain-containing protein [Chloroflexota bacterium]
MDKYNRPPNFFWPVILIGAGAILLLSNMGIVDLEFFDLINLIQLWPLLLIAIGINFLFGQRVSWLGSLLSLGLGLAVVAFFLLAPGYIEPFSSADMITESFADPLAGAESARVSLDFDSGTLKVFPLTDSNNLVEVDVTHDQDLTFNASGSARRNISLNLDNELSIGFIGFFEDQQIVGEVGLHPGLPIELSVDVGGGSAELDLTGLDMTDLQVSSGSGSIKLTYPESSLPVDLSAGSGSINVQTSAGSELELEAEVGSGRIRVEIAEGVYGEVELQSGSGGITVYLPEGTAVRVDGTTGSGSVRVPGDFVRVSGSDRISGDSGAWESPGFDDADQQLVIEFSIGSGSFKLVYQ